MVCTSWVNTMLITYDLPKLAGGRGGGEREQLNKAANIPHIQRVCELISNFTLPNLEKCMRSLPPFWLQRARLYPRLAATQIMNLKIPTTSLTANSTHFSAILKPLPNRPQCTGNRWNHITFAIREQKQNKILLLTDTIFNHASLTAFIHIINPRLFPHCSVVAVLTMCYHV